MKDPILNFLQFNIKLIIIDLDIKNFWIMSRILKMKMAIVIKMINTIKEIWNQDIKRMKEIINFRKKDLDQEVDQMKDRK